MKIYYQVRFFALLLLEGGFSLSTGICQDNNSTREYALSVTELVSDPSRQVGTLNQDSVASLPIGIVKEINDTKYIIAIDSAVFLPEGAYLNAYAALDLPGADDKIIFAGKNIRFNPGGVVSGNMARLVLVSDHVLKTGPHTSLHLDANGNNYVEWDCNGFKSVQLSGEFRFNSELLEPDSATGNSYVSASFTVKVSDLNNMMIGVSFSPFRIKGAKEIVFFVTDAVADMSDQENAPGMVFPHGYFPGCNGSIQLWRGFYIRNFTVQLPAQLNKSDDPLEVSAQNLVIDDAGVSGVFTGTNLVAMNEGDMNGWGFSVSELQVAVSANHLTSGSMEGKISIPVLDDNELAYSALISENYNTGETGFLFTVQPADNFSMSCFSSVVDIHPSTVLSVGKTEEKFIPQLSMNGSVSIGSSNAVISGIEFQNLVLGTEAPYITNGIFTLSGSGDMPHSVSNFPVSVSDIIVGVQNGSPVMAMNFSFNTMDGGNNNFSLETSLRVKTKLFPETNKPEFDGVQISQVEIDLQTQPFSLEGILSFHEDDPVYGKGFMGSIQFLIPAIMENPAVVTACFGRTVFRYWYVDVTAPVEIMIGANTKITSLMGGVSYHMRGSKNNSQMIADAQNSNTGAQYRQTYIPDETMGIGFRAGAGFEHSVRPELINGDIVLSVLFNSGGGLNSIGLNGMVYMLAKRNERNSSGNKISGSINISYDHINKIFDAQLNATMNMMNKITGNASAKIYFSPDLWYVWVGKPSQRAIVSVHNLATAQSYFMVGQQIEPMPLPPSQILSVIPAAGNSQRDNNAISAGNGLAVGMGFNASIDKTIGFDNFSIYGRGYAGAGFDMTMFNYGPAAHCSGSPESIGLNGFYLQGQIYAYLGINIGVTGKLLGQDFDIVILSGNAAVLLQGKLPSPTFIQGFVHLDATVLSVIHVNLDFDFQFGNNCTIITG